MGPEDYIGTVQSGLLAEGKQSLDRVLFLFMINIDQ